MGSSVFGELLYGAGVYGSGEGAEPVPVPDEIELLVLFDILSAGDSPLIVQFDIVGLPAALTPLLVEFDVVEANGDALTVTFDILTDLVSRRLSDDIQGPVAEVTLS